MVLGESGSEAGGVMSSWLFNLFVDGVLREVDVWIL